MIKAIQKCQICHENMLKVTKNNSGANCENAIFLNNAKNRKIRKITTEIKNPEIPRECLDIS